MTHDHPGPCLTDDIVPPFRSTVLSTRNVHGHRVTELRSWDGETVTVDVPLQGMDDGQPGPRIILNRNQESVLADKLYAALTLGR